MNGDVLLVLARPPEGPHVKTRLQTVLSEDEARRLYTAFLEDLDRRFRRLPVAVRWYFTEPPATFRLHGTLHAQSGTGLGPRMHAALDDAFAAGAARAVLVGTDLPTLPLRIVQAAFDALRVPDRVVVGPAMDGGYYLLGTDRPRPGLFHGLTYSHERVLAELRARVRDEGAEEVLLEPWYDVDRPEDLTALHASPDRSLAPATARALEVLAVKYPGLFAKPKVTKASNVKKGDIAALRSGND